MVILSRNAALAATLLGVCPVLSGCGESAVPAVPAAVADVAAAAVIPEAVNGWREYPLRDGVVKLHPEQWRSDIIDIAVPAGVGLEYKLAMKTGDTVVYAIRYDGLEHPGLMEVEFHGHTEKGADGVGDLMFYSKTGGSPENGSFTAPWDGIHGWYLKNDGGAEVNATLEVAGYYALEAQEHGVVRE